MADALSVLKKAIDDNAPAQLYAFHGEESYLKAHYLDLLEKKCAGAFPDFDMVKLDGDTVTLQAFRDAIESLPMGGERKLIEVWDYNLFGNGPLKDALPEIISDLPDYVCLVFVFEALDFKPDKRTGIWKAFLKYGHEVEFKRASNSDLIVWLKRRFSALGKEISGADCEHMLFICGALMTNLVTEVEKIAAGTENKTITSSDIDKMASRSLEAGVFDLTDSMAAGDLDKALLILRDLIDKQDSPIAILSVVAKQFRRLYGAKLARDKGMSMGEIAQLLEFRSEYPARIAVSTAQRFSLRKLRRAQKLCLEADISLKSNDSDSKRVIELLLMRVMA